MADRKDVIVEEERSSEDIRQGISARRRSISQTLDRLETRIQEKFNWRGAVARNPYPALGIAAGVGVLLSRVIRYRRSPRERMRDAVAEMLEDLVEDATQSLKSGILRAARPEVTKASLAIAIAKTVMSLAKKKSKGSLASEASEMSLGSTIAIERSQGSIS
jgi:hypothetical protein